MNEIFFIAVQLILFLILSIFPLNKLTTPETYKNLENSSFNCIMINIVILLFIFLVFSFFNFNLIKLLIFIIILYSPLFIIFLNKINKNFSSKKNFDLFFFFIFINFIFFLNLAYNLEIGWDGLATWIFKSNLFYNNKNYFDLFNENITFKQYPHLGSYTWAFFWKNSFMDKEYFGRLFFKYIYLVSLFVIAISIKNISNFKKIIIVFCLILLTQDYDNTLEGYQEYLLFSILVFAGKLIQIIVTKPQSQKNKFNILFFFLLLNTLLLPWIKNEGFFYSIFISLIFLFVKTRFLNKILFFLFSFCNLIYQTIIIKFIYKLDSIFQISLDSIFMFIFKINFFDFFSKIFYITLYFVHGILKYPIAIIYILSILYIVRFKKIAYAYKLFVIFFTLNILFIYGVYLLTPHDLIWHLQTTVKRLVLQTSGFYIFLTVMFINDSKYLIK